MTHGRPLSRPPALGSSPSEGAAAAPGHCGDSRRNDYANPRSPLPLSRGWQLMLRDACGLIATPLPGWPAATPPSRAINRCHPGNGNGDQKCPRALSTQASHACMHACMHVPLFLESIRFPILSTYKRTSAKSEPRRRAQKKITPQTL